MPPSFDLIRRFPDAPWATEVASAAVTIHFASKLTGEVAHRLRLSPRLGEGLVGVIGGVSVLPLVVFPEGRGIADTSLILQLLQGVHHLDASGVQAVFGIQSEVINILAELGQLHSRKGQIIGTPFTDDVLGIIVLAVVASLAKTGAVDITNVAILIVSSGAFLGGAVRLGRLKTRGNTVISAICFTFLMAFLADALPLGAILGAFVAGLVLDETDTCPELPERIKPVVDLVVPIFFVGVGAKSLLTLLNPRGVENRSELVLAGFIVTLGVLAKLSRGWPVFGQVGINCLAMGLEMVSQGEIGLVFARIGAALGAFDSLELPMATVEELP